MKNTMDTKWFESWFNSPYYHILYKNRNHKEAEAFIDKLIEFLNPPNDSRFLDLGCGKGRHSIYLNKKGFNVVGVDLSPESIEHASQYTQRGSNSLEFYVQDMRKPARTNYYNYVLNLFTSFGYFDNPKDDYATIASVNKALKAEGIFVLDFMNADKVITNLIPHEKKTSENIEFTITKKVENNFIIKNIAFTDKGNEYNFQEKVKALSLTDFERYFSASQLKVVHLFGDYNLSKFDNLNSDRLIIVGQKA